MNGIQAPTSPGGLATLRSTELHALCVMTSRGMGGLTVSSPRSCTGRQHQHSSWLSESLQRGFVGAQRTFAGAAVQPVPQEEDVQLTANAVEKLQELLAGKEGQHLRLTVEAGGCSGFSYKFDLDDGEQEGDRVFEAGGVRLVADAMSYEFVRGAKVDYSQELIKSAFEVIDNPNAEKGCGCGTSFAPK